MKNVYIAVDSVKNEAITIFMSENDTAAIRDNLGVLSRVLPLQDIKIFHIGTIDSLFENSKDNPVELSSPRSVPLDLYKFPDPKPQKFSAGNSPIEDKSIDNLAK